MKSRIHIATRTALQLIRVEVGPCSRRLAAGARLPSLLQGTATSPSAGPASATLADRWKLAVLGGRSGALFGTSAFAHASSLSSVLVGLAHTTMLRNSKTGSAMPSAPLQARAFSSSSTGLSGNEQTTNKGTEPKTDLKAVIAQYGAVGGCLLGGANRWRLKGISLLTRFTPSFHHIFCAFLSLCHLRTRLPTIRRCNLFSGLHIRSIHHVLPRRHPRLRLGLPPRPNHQSQGLLWHVNRTT